MPLVRSGGELQLGGYLCLINQEYTGEMQVCSNEWGLIQVTGRIKLQNSDCLYLSLAGWVLGEIEVDCRLSTMLMLLYVLSLPGSQLEQK